ncbi:MAG: hypothetical protein KBT03_00305 [Bacteroidales bacterium]|nr:hypothetical protein [Candidatus Scybalousia scybalohippi]
MKIKFTGRGGYPLEVVHAKEILTIGEYYEISRVAVDRCYTDVYLKGFDLPFNSCLFEEDDTWNKVFRDWETDGTFEIEQKYAFFFRNISEDDE